MMDSEKIFTIDLDVLLRYYSLNNLTLSRSDIEIYYDK